jgi:TPR repeat protein
MGKSEVPEQGQPVRISIGQAVEMEAGLLAPGVGRLAIPLYGLLRILGNAGAWFEKAADQGSAWAQMNLGLLYVRGQGVPLDNTKAIFWLRNAAENNDSNAQYNLGWAYESGSSSVRQHASGCCR